MISDKLRILKDKLLNAKDFNHPCQFFMDFVSNDSEMKRLEFPMAIPPKIMAVIAATGAAALQKRKPKIRRVLLLDVIGENFVHGTGFIDDRLFTFFCFTDIEKGMIAISLGGHRVTFARLSIMSVKSPESSDALPQTISLN